MLETVQLPGAARRTTRIGFGGSGLMGGLSERESLRLLETAFDAGIRHFDVAPSYGHGMAERCLGKFLRGKTGEITVTTKYGILPPQRAGLLAAARSAARPIVRRMPSVRRRVAAAAASLKTKARFTKEEALHSLEHSLSELGVDRVDLWLLHEATADDFDSSDLLPFLEEMKEQGRIGMYGIGGESRHLPALWQRHRDYCRVLQFEWSLLDPAASFPGTFCIHHRAISGALSTIQKWFERDSSLCRSWSDATDANLTDPEILSALLLRVTLSQNADSLVLFSSRLPAHILTNVRVASDPGWEARSRRLLALIANQITAPG